MGGDGVEEDGLSHSTKGGDGKQKPISSAWYFNMPISSKEIGSYMNDPKFLFEDPLYGKACNFVRIMKVVWFLHMPFLYFLRE